MPTKRRLLLVGAGHTHLLALLAIAAQVRDHGVEVTLVSDEPLTPYSGLLPGVVAGLVPREDMMIDVERFTRQRRIDFILDRVVGIEPAMRLVTLASGRVLGYEMLSVNVGGECRDALRDEGGDVMPVKPIKPFLDWLAGWERQSRTTCAVVGDGVAAAEMALSLDARLRARGRVGGVYLVGKRDRVVSNQPVLGQAVNRLLVARDISPLLGVPAAAAVPGGVRLADGTEHHADHVVACTGVRPWPVPATAGLAVDGRGFMQVNSALRSVSHPDVFGCGDCAAVAGQDCPKAGVHAVRQAPVLAHNLLAACTARPLRQWQAQRDALVILCLGGGKALAHRNGLKAAGRVAWWCKNRLDRRFMRRFD